MESSPHRVGRTTLILLAVTAAGCGDEASTNPQGLADAAVDSAADVAADSPTDAGSEPHGDAAPPEGLYVATDGDDDNPGTLAEPLRTIQRCAELVEPGEQCVVRGGTYRESVTPARSGTAAAPIRFLAYGDEEVAISGADSVPEDAWTPLGGPIHRATVPGHVGHETQVFVAGERMWRARWPNLDSFTLEELHDKRAVIEASTGAAVSDGALDQPTGFWTGATMHLQGGYGKWLCQTTTVTGFDGPSHTLQIEPFFISDDVLGPIAGSRYYLSGVLGALDMEREWHLDEGDDALYLWAPGGGAPAMVEVQTRRVAVDLSGLSYVEFVGIDVLAGLVLLDDAHHCVIDDMRLLYPYDSPRATEGYLSQLRTGLVISGNANAVKNSEIAFSSGSGIYLEGNDNRIVNCYLHHIDTIGTYAAGVVVLSGYRNLISHTTISDLGRSAIWQNGASTLVQHNHLARGMRMTHDGGAIYAWGEEHERARIHHNVIHDFGLTTDAKAVGIYLDNYDRNAIVDHNLVYNINGNGITLNTPQNTAFVYNNTVYNVTGAGLRHWGESPYDSEWYGSRVFNNIFPDAPWYATDALRGHNLESATTEVYENAEMADFRPRAGSPAIDVGVEISGITDGYLGVAPDVGAFEHSAPAWSYGHDFSSQPNPSYEAVQTPFLNLVVNGGFEIGLDGWTEEGDCTVQSVRALGSPPADKRGMLFRLELSNGHGGVYQQIQLEPNTRYALSGWLSRSAGEEIALAIRGWGGGDLWVSGQAESYTSRAELRFTTGATGPLVEVHLWKDSVGAAPAYADDVLLLPVDERRQAESWAQASGIETFTTGIGHCDGGDWVRYDLVDLGDGSGTFRARLGVPAEHAGQTVRVRVGAVDGPVIATLVPTSTGDFGIYEVQETNFSSALMGPQTIFVLFEGTFGVGNFDWFELDVT